LGGGVTSKAAGSVSLLGRVGPAAGLVDARVARASAALASTETVAMIWVTLLFWDVRSRRPPKEIAAFRASSRRSRHRAVWAPFAPRPGVTFGQHGPAASVTTVPFCTSAGRHAGVGPADRPSPASPLPDLPAADRLHRHDTFQFTVRDRGNPDGCAFSELSRARAPRAR